MKPLIFFRTPVLAFVFLAISSCANQSSDNTAGTDATTMTDSATTATSAATTNASSSTIITTPQNMMVVRHKVADFNKWQVAYNEHDSVRLAYGLHTYVISRGVKDSSIVQVTLKVDDMAKAKAFAKNPSLKQAMQKGGVMGAPVINFTTMTEQDTANINSALRSRTTFTVKDWNKWQHSFDSSRQMRKDNGLQDRAYGHDADDNHKVTVVLALMDTAKAFAFWKSDQLKKQQAASGVVSAPERFIYRIVKRY